MLEAVRIRQQGFSCRLPFQEPLKQCVPSLGRGFWLGFHHAL